MRSWLRFHEATRKFFLSTVGFLAVFYQKEELEGLAMLATTREYTKVSNAAALPFIAGCILAAAGFRQGCWWNQGFQVQ